MYVKIINVYLKKLVKNVINHFNVKLVIVLKMVMNQYLHVNNNLVMDNNV